MGQSTFEKVVRNQTLSPSGRGAASNPRPRPDKRDVRTFQVMVHKSDKPLIRAAAMQECAYYNALVTELNPRLRSQPECLLALSDKIENLFGDLAYTGINPRKLTNVLLPGLEHHRSVLFEDNGVQKQIPERLMMVLELAATPGKIHPGTRRAMALELMRFYRAQAMTLTAEVPKHLREEQVIRHSGEMLEPMARNVKNHIQLSRSFIEVKFDVATNRTTLRLPYGSHPLEVTDDLSRPNQWNVLVLRVPEAYAADSPWRLDLRKSQSQYLIKLLDSSHGASREPNAFKSAS